MQKTFCDYCEAELEGAILSFKIFLEREPGDDKGFVITATFEVLKGLSNRPAELCEECKNYMLKRWLDSRTKKTIMPKGPNQ